MNYSTPLWRRWKLPYIAVIGIVFALITILGRPTPEVHVPEVIPPKSSYTQSIAGIGVVEPKSELISIGVELSGVVREVNVKVGDSVKKGDVLFALDQRDINGQIAIIERTLAVARVKAQDDSAQFAIVSGVKDKRAVAQDDFNKRKFGKDIALARVEEIGAQLSQALITKDRLTIKAPISGQILEMNVRPGEFASTGALSTALIRMGDVSQLHVRVEIDEENANLVHPENAAKGMRRGVTDDTIPLTFVRFEPYVQPKQNLAVSGQRVDTRVLKIIYALPEGVQSLFVGQQMDVFIDTNMVKDTPKPAEAP
jgi:HlyD family secretion protein